MAVLTLQDLIDREEKLGQDSSEETWEENIPKEDE